MERENRIAESNNVIRNYRRFPDDSEILKVYGELRLRTFCLISLDEEVPAGMEGEQIPPERFLLEEHEVQLTKTQEIDLIEFTYFLKKEASDIGFDSSEEAMEVLEYRAKKFLDKLDDSLGGDWNYDGMYDSGNPFEASYEQVSSHRATRVFLEACHIMPFGDIVLYIHERLLGGADMHGLLGTDDIDYLKRFLQLDYRALLEEILQSELTKNDDGSNGPYREQHNWPVIKEFLEGHRDRNQQELGVLIQRLRVFLKTNGYSTYTLAELSKVVQLTATQVSQGAYKGKGQFKKGSNANGTEISESWLQRQIDQLEENLNTHEGMER